MRETWGTVTLLVTRRTAFEAFPGLIVPLLTPLVVPVRFLFPEGRENPLVLSHTETRSLTVGMSEAINKAWPDGASTTYWLTGIMEQADPLEENRRPTFTMTWQLPPRGADVAWANEEPAGRG
jgi:hypothetical protein